MKPKPEKESAREEEDEKRFVQGGSNANYFAKKMAALKSKGKLFTDWLSTPAPVIDN
jgi:hypothetical protein